ncbi:ATP-binding protein [Paraburkholderia sp. MM6662-R1]|uniref:ATP-binding protein n=1 Tax=Paraburkholderia sp. MM6662-R1 TaxID=2991066 RepID=UPI003D1991A1
MASCTQTQGDSDAGENPGARTSLSAGETVQKIERRRFVEFMNFFQGPVAALSTDQSFLVKRELLKSLSRRAVYWVALLLFGSAVFFVFGHWIKTSDIYLLFRFVWIFGLWGMAAPMAICLLKKTMALPKHAGVNAVDQMQWAWAGLIMLTSLWWAAGSFGLIPSQYQVGPSYHYSLARHTFLLLTMISHAFTLLLLAPSLRATLGSLVLGAIPFGFSIGKALFLYRPATLNWLTVQLIGYCLIAWFLCDDQKRACVKEFILVEARSQAEAAIAEKNQFIAAISHDVRQPLTTLVLKLNYIRRNIKSTNLAEDLSIAQRQVDAMVDMINGALDICRLESGTWNVEIQEVVLASLLYGIVVDMQPLVRAKGLKLRLHSRPYLTHTDRHALDRIVRNMVTNAIRYTPSEQGGKKGHILVSCQRQGNLVKISVWDNGIGIPEGRQADIFKSYVQVDNPERNREKGFGLGLSIVQGLANLLGHKLDVDSTPGRGSRFSVTVPFIGLIPPELIEVQTGEDGDPDLTNMVVVIIEDNSDLRIEISMRLIEHGCYVVAGESSYDVIEQLRIEALASGPHFILSDYRLEHEDGIAAIAAVRAATDASIPAILWSGDTSSAALKKVAVSGMKLLSKPVSEHTLLTLLARYKPPQSLPMASCTQTRGDSNAGENPGAGTSLSAGATVQKVARRRFVGFVNYFLGPVAALSTQQNLLVKRALLESLSRRAVYWVALLLFGSSLVFVFGTWIKTLDIYFLFRTVWIFGLWGMAAPMAICLLKKTMALPKHAGVNTVEQMHWAWTTLVTLTSLWWAAGSFGLFAPQFHGPLPILYWILGRYSFLEMTMMSYVFTLLLLAPSLRATLGSLVLGTIPLGFSMGTILLFHRPAVLNWFAAQLIGYCFIAWFFCYNLKRGYVKEIVLVEARSQAEAAMAEKSQFIAAISHDLRQPLTTLGLKLNYIERNIKSTNLVEDLSIAQRQVDAMEGMINGTLDICRLESGTWNVEIQAVVLASLLHDIVVDMQPLARAKGLTLRLHSRPYLTHTDRHALDRIVRNMVTNAIRYTPSEQGGKKGHILVSCQRQGNLVKISVWDNGIGIPEGRQADIFKSYVQVDNPERNREKGFGLGLSIVQGLANLLGHKLDVDSTPGRGSRFSVTVPFIGLIPPELIEVQTGEDGDPDLTNMVVVIIEDNSDLRIEISMRLIEHGCYVVAGESSYDVIEQLRIEALASGPHFILSDYRLEHEDGIAAIAAVRAATDASIPAILWSGDTSSAVLKKVAVSGMKLLSKPVSEHTLLTLLARCKPKASIEGA